MNQLTDDLRDRLARIAARDWQENRHNCRGSFASVKAYAGYLRAETTGAIKATGHDRAAPPAPIVRGADLDSVLQQGRRDWAANAGGVRENFSNEKAYLGYLKASRRGQIRSAHR